MSIFAILVINRVWFLHSSLELGILLEEATFSGNFFKVINSVGKIADFGHKYGKGLILGSELHTPTKFYVLNIFMITLAGNV